MYVQVLHWGMALLLSTESNLSISCESVSAHICLDSLFAVQQSIHHLADHWPAVMVKSVLSTAELPTQ